MTNQTTGTVGFDAWGDGPAIASVPDYVTFRTCYISHDANKMCSPQYVRDWLASGRHIIFNFEDTANVLGRDGNADAQFAKETIRDRYGFVNVACIWSCDADVQAQLVDVYAHAWAGVFTPEKTGPYGSAAVINYCVVNGISKLGWETMSHGWTGGYDPTHAEIVQNGPGTIGGIAIDWDNIVQQPAAVEADVQSNPAPAPAPAPQPVNSYQWRATHNVLTPIAEDGVFGPKSWKALQYVLGVFCDGIPGPVTGGALQTYLNTLPTTTPHLALDDRIGPLTVEAVQRHLGDVAVDGGWGPKTSTSLQTHLNEGTF